MTLREDAQIIMDKALAASLPDAAVEKALKNKKFGSGRIVVVSIGKAAWQMAKTTVALLGDRISGRHCHYQIPARQRGVAAP